MMHRLRGWASGRQLWLPAGLWGLSLVAVYLGWWVGSDGPWAPFGPLAGIGCYLALLVSQGYRLAPGLVPRLDQPHSVVSVLVALLAVVLGLVAFRSSRSGASPLIS